MRKEFIIAIISGITIGVVVAFGIWRANSALKSENSQVAKEETPNPQENLSPDGVQLTIIKPEENDVITSSPVRVSGITKPQSIIIISAEQDDYIIRSGEDGSFEQDVNLTGGVNEILFALSDNGDSTQTRMLRIIYSTEFAKEESE